MRTVLRVDNLEKFYKNKGSVTKAVNHISFDVQQGEYVGKMCIRDRISAVSTIQGEYGIEIFS